MTAEFLFWVRSAHRIIYVTRELTSFALKTIAYAEITPSTLLPLFRDVIPRHGHLVRQLDLRSVLLGSDSLQPFMRPSEALDTVISTQTLLSTVNQFPNLYSFIIPADFDCDCDFEQILELLTGKITQLVMLAPDAKTLILQSKLFPANFRQSVKRIDLPSVASFVFSDSQGTWVNVLSLFPNLQHLSIITHGNPIMIGYGNEAASRAVAFASRPRLGHELTSGGIGGRLRTSIDFKTSTFAEDTEHINWLSESLWSLTLGPQTLTELQGYDYESESRLGFDWFALGGYFPHLTILSLSNIETRYDEDVEILHEAWAVPANLRWESGSEHFADLHSVIPPYFIKEDPIVPALKSNLENYFDLLDSFIKSPLATISLTGAHLSALLDCDFSLRVLKPHVDTLKQLIIKSGDTPTGGPTYFRLQTFCDDHRIRLAFEGTPYAESALDEV